VLNGDHFAGELVMAMRLCRDDPWLAYEYALRSSRKEATLEVAFLLYFLGKRLKILGAKRLWFGLKYIQGGSSPGVKGCKGLIGVGYLAREVDSAWWFFDDTEWIFSFDSNLGDIEKRCLRADVSPRRALDNEVTEAVEPNEITPCVSGNRGEEDPKG